LKGQLHLGCFETGTASAVPISVAMLPALAAEGCIEDSQIIPQGLKPIIFWAAFGTAEAVPFQNSDDLPGYCLLVGYGPRD
jgi:hypothetical protein